MDNKRMLENAVFGLILIVVAPIIVDGAIRVISNGYCYTANKVNTIKYNKKIKQGLKDGSIVEIDGKYYEVVID